MSEKAAAVQTAQEPKGSTTLSLVEPKTLFERISRIHDEIALRAFEIFAGRGGTSGHELDDWFKAETELLHPVHVQISESGDSVEVEAEVPGFTLKDLEVSVDSRCLTISRKKESSDERKKGKTLYKELCSNEILRVIDLPAEIETSKATGTLKNGVLVLVLPKSARAKAGVTKVEVKAV